MSAQNAGEAVAGQHCALTCSAARHDVIGSAGIQEYGTEDAGLNVSQLAVIL